MPIISIAQQARPKVAGMIPFARAQFAALSIVVVRTRSSTYLSRSFLEVPGEHLAGAQLARAELAVRAGAQALAPHLHSSAPLRHT